MGKITSKNNDLLRDSKQTTSPKIYNLLLDLVNDGREDLAEMVLKIDYLIEYANKSIKAKDFEEAKEAIQKAEERTKMLRRSNADIEHLNYLIEGVNKKLKKWEITSLALIYIIIYFFYLCWNLCFYRRFYHLFLLNQ